MEDASLCSIVGCENIFLDRCFCYDTLCREHKQDGANYSKHRIVCKGKGNGGSPSFRSAVAYRHHDVPDADQQPCAFPNCHELMHTHDSEMNAFLCFLHRNGTCTELYDALYKNGDIKVVLCPIIGNQKKPFASSVNAPHLKKVIQFLQM
jgi:hypothetical protein